MDILHKVNELIASANAPTSSSLKERVVFEYKNQTLLKLKSILESQTDETTLVSQLSDFLNSNWELVRGTALCYTALPNDELTLLLCELAEYISVNDADAQPAIAYLMPGISLDCLQETQYQVRNLPLEQVLRTHVISTSGHFLIPVKQFPELLETREAQRYNLYYDYNIMGAEESLISAQEIEHLAEHSVATKDYYDTYRDFELLKSEDRSLLGYLRRLERSLFINSSDLKGVEEDAAGGAYPALIRFFEYYQLIPEADKAKIPDRILKEIDKLQMLLTDSTVNINAVENLETCIATRREKLAEKMQGHEEALASIGISDDDLQQLLQTKESELSKQKQDLISRIDKDHYRDGEDKLGFTRALLEQLNITLHIQSIEQLTDFTRSSSEQIEDLLENNDQLIDEITDLFDDIEDLVAFIHDLSVDKIKPLKKIIASYLYNPEDAVTLLTSFEKLKFNTLVDVIKDEMPSLIENNSDFRSILKDLSQEQRGFILEFMLDDLSNQITSADDLTRTLIYLNPEQSRILLNALQDKLPDIIKTSSSFGDALRYLNPEMRTVVFESMKDTLPNLIQNLDDFLFAFEFLNTEQRGFLKESSEEKVRNYIKGLDGFSLVNKYIDLARQGIWYQQQDHRAKIRQLRNIVFENMIDKLPDIIKESKDLLRIYSVVDPSERELFLEAMKDKLPNIIKSSQEFIAAYTIMRPNERAILTEAIKHKLPDIIKNREEFFETYRRIDRSHRGILIEAMKDKLPDIITDKEAFLATYALVNISDAKQFLEAMKDKLPDIITDNEAFLETYKSMSISDRAIYLEYMKDKLPDLITESKDYFSIFKELNNEGRTIFLEAMKNKLPDLFQNNEAFLEAYSGMQLKDGSIFLTAMKDKLPNLINNNEEFVGIFKEINLKDRSIFLQALKNKLPDIFKDSKQFLEAYGKMYGSDRDIFLEAMKDKMPDIFKDSEQFLEAYGKLHGNDRDIFLEAMKDKLPDILQSKQSFIKAYTRLQVKNRAILFQAMKDKLPDLINNKKEFLDTYVYMRTNEQDLFLEAMIEKLPEIINNREDYLEVYKEIAPRVRPIFEEAMKGMLQDTSERRERDVQESQDTLGESEEELVTSNPLPNSARTVREEPTDFLDSTNAVQALLVKMNFDDQIKQLEDLKGELQTDNPPAAEVVGTFIEDVKQAKCKWEKEPSEWHAFAFRCKEALNKTQNSSLQDNPKWTNCERLFKRSINWLATQVFRSEPVFQTDSYTKLSMFTNNIKKNEPDVENLDEERNQP